MVKTNFFLGGKGKIGHTFAEKQWLYEYNM